MNEYIVKKIQEIPNDDLKKALTDIITSPELDTRPFQLSIVLLNMVKDHDIFEEVMLLPTLELLDKVKHNLTNETIDNNLTEEEKEFCKLTSLFVMAGLSLNYINLFKTTTIEEINNTELMEQLINMQKQGVVLN